MAAKKEKKECFLRKTDIKLLDGKEYSFRALPLSSKTVKYLRTMMEGKETAENGFEILSNITSMIELSLSYDQDAETVDYIVNYGLIPSVTEKSELLENIMQAMMAQSGGNK